MAINAASLTPLGRGIVLADLKKRRNLVPTQARPFNPVLPGTERKSVAPL
jgi:hypothetical protein